MSKNERITENLVRDILRDLNFYDIDHIIVEEQKSQIEEIKKLLRGASKTGKGGIGAPEFIISTNETPDFLIVFECKADVKKHSSQNLDRPVDYAVDGVLHYAKKLSKSYNVIAVAVSGQSKSGLKISNFLIPKGSKIHKPLVNRDETEIKNIVSLENYIEHGTFDPEVAKNRHDDLMAFSRELHNFMRDNARLTESEKPLLVSGTLIALKNKAFAKSFDEYKPEELQREWMRVIKEEFKKAKIPHSKEYSMTQPYSSIAVHPNLGKAQKKFPKGVLYELIKMLNEKVWPFISIYHDFDVVGQFYGEFLKYTGGDKKALGIVLTPRHITELFSLMANVQKNSKVLDICAGTGGFLISAMHQMFKKAETKEEKEYIKSEGLIGIENQPHMYALAASNMILRGDGKANLHQGSCFDEAITKEVTKHNCNIGFLNPPYSQSDEDLHELVFVNHMLNCLTTGATGIVILPVALSVTTHPFRYDLLKNHTLDAVMSMPTELFYPVGAVPCIMVFKAKIPHKENNKKTWFGYWKDDGFSKTKHKGRIDPNNNWESIRDSWVESYRNREVIAGQSVLQHVSEEDEWCAEAYMETDYSKMTKDYFANEVKKYQSFKLFMNTDKNNEQVEYSNWKEFKLEDLFELKKGKRLTKANMLPGNTPFIGAIDSNNGLSTYIGQEPIFEGNTITVNYDGNGVAEAYYQPVPFWALDSVNVLYPKFDLTPEIAMFIITIIRQEKFRFNYGRKWHLQRMKDSKIKLPAISKTKPDWEFMENYIKQLNI
ncbi:N-6 DNA methylase [uncultured Maribacter sp.]|uniref:N-6 DNA methylase n=1 Tax=uncultured Maribacter sp. TaxID=431308 RepID=UPI002617FEB1|nr:N-6 DNA methylase [uncultured Maribacter sp.]